MNLEHCEKKCDLYNSPGCLQGENEWHCYNELKNKILDQDWVTSRNHEMVRKAIAAVLWV